MRYTFFLGGHDLEMLEIGRLVRAALGAEAVVDHRLPWHAAKASAYRDRIAETVAQDGKPVLVELKPDVEEALLQNCILIDHHGARAGAEAATAIEQVFALMDLPPEAWTRRLALIAANDRGWIPELRAMGASDDEIAAIRAEDRAAQGVTPEEEVSAHAALATAEQHDDLLIVHLPHDRTSPVFDRLALEAPHDRPPDTLVIGSQELNFSGSGARVERLAHAFPQGWYGGALPQRGFWGHGTPLPPLAAVLEVLAR